MMIYYITSPLLIADYLKYIIGFRRIGLPFDTAAAET